MPMVNNPKADNTQVEAAPHSVSITPAASTMGA